MGIRVRTLSSWRRRPLGPCGVHQVVSEQDGDGAGYDILSFEHDASKRYIEVKTTNGGPLTPFVVTRNEVEFSAEVGGAFHLYRLFEFAERARLFVLKGPLAVSVQMEAIDFRARLKAA